MAKIKLVIQMQQTECGLCALQMILNYYDVNVALNDLNNLTEVGRDGLSVKTVKQILRTYNMDSSTTNIHFSKSKETKKLLPFIAMEKKGHYVVVSKLKTSGAIIYDPAVGKRFISYNELREKYYSSAITAQPGENFIKVPRRKRQSILFKSIRLYKIEFIKMFLLSMLVYLGMFLIPLLSKQLIDTIMYEDLSKILIKKWIIVIAIAFAAYYVVSYIKSIISVKASMTLDSFLSSTVIDKLFRNNLKFFLLRPSADLQYRLSLLRGIKVLLNEMVVGTIIDAGSVIVIFIYVLYVQPLYSMVLLISAFTIIVMNLLLRNKMVLYKNEETISDSQMQILQHDIFRSIFDIKALGLEDRKRKAWTDAFTKYLYHHKKYEKLMAFYRTMLSTMNLFLPILTIIIGCWIIYNTGSRQGIGTIVSLQTILGIFLSSILSISQLFENIYLIQSYMLRINDILDQEDEKDGNKIVDFKGNIKIKNLSFSYPGSDQKILDNINLDINAGQKIAFTGSSGSGKSTLLNILTGLYSDFQGEVFIEGINSRDINNKKYRQQLGVVPQTPILFTGSLRENLDQENFYDDEELYNVLKIVSLDEFVQSMPMKLNTIIVENGSNFSGGQKQRIALARALLNSNLVMFLDEATSSLDSLTEARIVEYLKDMNVTQVIVAHRLSTIIDADCIYVMREGKIVESGTHEELLKLKGEYYKLNHVKEVKN